MNFFRFKFQNLLREAEHFAHLGDLKTATSRLEKASLLLENERRFQGGNNKKATEPAVA